MTGQDIPETDKGGADPGAPIIERRAPRWMKLALVASLAVNAVVLGLVVGVVLRGGPHDAPPPAFREGTLPLIQGLSPQDRRAIGREIRRDLPPQDGKPAMTEIREILTLLRAESFDAVAFASHLQARLARGQARIKVSQDALIRHLDGLSLAERRAYADRVEAALESRRKPASRP